MSVIIIFLLFCLSAGVLSTVAWLWWRRVNNVITRVVSVSAFERVALDSGHLVLTSEEGAHVADALARGAKDLEQARKEYVSSHIGSVSSARKQKLEDGAKYAQGLITNGLVRTRYASWIPELSGRSRWKVAILEDRAENGYPHTIGDLICIPVSVLDEYDVPRLGRLLLHERVHVIQRTDPVSAGKYAEQLGYTRTGVRRRDVVESLRLPLRANPDLDAWMYVHRDRTMPAAVYTSHRPRRLADVKIIDTKTGRRLPSEAAAAEHPHEAVAYDVVDAAKNKKIETCIAARK